MTPPIAACAEVEMLAAALREIADLKATPYTMPPDWSEQIAACAECKRYRDHPIQRGICDEHRRQLWARERHEQHEAIALWPRAQCIALDALAELSRRANSES